MKASFLLSLFLLLPLAAEAGLPRIAISIPPDQSFEAGLKAAEQCDAPGKLIVLPPLAFDLAGGETSVSPYDEQALRSAPEGSEVWLHLTVGTGSLAGKESEQEITQRVDAFTKLLPFSAAAVRGLVVEIREPLRSSDPLAFGLVRLALTAKANNASLDSSPTMAIWPRNSPPIPTCWELPMPRAGARMRYGLRSKH
jgi:hypothetical protein